MRAKKEAVYPEDGVVVTPDEEEKKEVIQETTTKTTKRYHVGEIVTQTQPVIVDSKTNTEVDQLQVLTEILNKLQRIEETICGDK